MKRKGSLTTVVPSHKSLERVAPGSPVQVVRVDEHDRRALLAELLDVLFHAGRHLSCVDFFIQPYIGLVLCQIYGSLQNNKTAMRSSRDLLEP